MKDFDPIEPKDQPPQELPPATLGTVIALAWRIGWAALILFGIVGTVAGHEAGPFVILIVTAMWVALRILLEGLVCLRMLMFIFSSDETPEGTQEQSEDEDTEE